jgi:hypothetical protein
MHDVANKTVAAKCGEESHNGAPSGVRFASFSKTAEMAE